MSWFLHDRLSVSKVLKELNVDTKKRGFGPSLLYNTVQSVA